MVLVYHACTVILFMLQHGGYCAPCPSQTSSVVQRRTQLQSRVMIVSLHLGLWPCQNGHKVMVLPAGLCPSAGSLAHFSEPHLMLSLDTRQNDAV